eukprot:SAG11_NODE_12412_length_705_cov_0.770627_1_plen_59_part_00
MFERECAMQPYGDGPHRGPAFGIWAAPLDLGEGITLRVGDTLHVTVRTHVHSDPAMLV